MGSPYKHYFMLALLNCNMSGKSQASATISHLCIFAVTLHRGGGVPSASTHSMKKSIPKIRERFTGRGHAVRVNSIGNGSADFSRPHINKLKTIALTLRAPVLGSRHTLA